MISSFRCNQLDYTVIIILFTCLLTGSCILGKPQGESVVKESRPSSRRLVASRTDDGFWSTNARLPTGFQSGQTDHSRYKVRRDGSISLALKLPTSISRPSYHQGPSELRSFSVVLSDVDVVGGYNDSEKSVNSTQQDAYKNAGVSMYKLHSNSIHRMNASWKLNPRNSSPTSQELVEFLKFFASSSSASAANESEHTSSAFHQDNEHGSNYSLKREPNEQRNREIEHRDGGDELMMGIEVPLKTHVDDNRSATVLGQNIKSILGKSRRTNGASGAIVLHDLISTLGKLNNNVRKGNRTADSAEEKRMKPVDPQQTAADLKRLMALLFTSAKNETNNTNSNNTKNDKDQVDLVNVLIAPTSDGSGTGRSNQKIIILPNAQIKKLINKVVESSSTSSSSQLISSIDNEDHPEIPITPVGFPIAAGGYLNLHHPNLQFHQALHHLIANGTAPTSMNTTVKTNIINVFVLNFNNDPNKQPSSNNEQRDKASGIHKIQQQVKQTQKQPTIEQSSFSQSPSKANKPIVIEKVQGSPLVFYEKIGVLSAPVSLSTTSSSPTTIPTVNSTERVNILDLLPADLNAFKQANDDDATEQGPDLTSGAHKILTSLTRDPNHQSGGSHEHQHHHHHHHNSSAVADVNKPVHVYVKTPLEVPHLWLLHQNSERNNSNNEDKQVEMSLPDYEDPDFPEDNISFGGKFPVGPDLSFQDLYDDSPLTTTMPPETIITTSKRSPFYALRNNQTIKDPFLYKPHSNYSTKGSNNSSDSKDNINQIVMSQLESANKIKPVASSPPGNNQDDSRYNTTAATITTPNDDDNDSNLRNRVRKVLTALGYSALPTLAAGAAATWPYWVPLVAAGKKLRKKRMSNNSNNLFSQATGGEGPIIPHPKENPTKLQAVNKAIQFADSEQPLPFQAESAYRTRQRPTSGKFIESLKATASPEKFNPSFTSNSSSSYNSSADQAKWIRVEVITESSLSSSLSSPTLKRRHHVNLTKHNKPNHHLHWSTTYSDKSHLPTTYSDNIHLSTTYSDNRPISPPHDNLRYDLLHQTSDNNTTTTVVPTKKQDLPLLKNFFNNVISNEWNATTTASPASTTIKPLKRPGHLVNTNADLNSSHVSNDTLEADNESLKRQKLESLTFAKNAYASAILLPLWLPVLFGQRQARAPTIHRTHK